MAPLDVITLGETMLRFSPPGLRRIEQATTMEVEVGGSESNVAIALTRLGLRAAWLSRLPATPLGRLIAQQITRHGVDTSHVTWATEGRVGLYFLEEGRAPRGSQVIYDRAGSAFSMMTPSDLPAPLFHAGMARHLHLTGITPALGTGPAATARHALDLAKASGMTVSFDLNYRRLWTPEEARMGCEAFMQQADLIFIPITDARLLFSFADESPPEVLDRLASTYPDSTLVLTLGADGAIASEPGGEMLRQPAFRTEPVGRVGGGDAFAAGFLYSYLGSDDDPARLSTALSWAAAAAALKYSIVGDIPFIDRAEVDSLLSLSGDGTVLLR